MAEPFQWFLGIDWGYHAHQFTVLDATGTRHDTRRVDHDAAAIADALAWVGTTTQAPPSQIAVAIETPRGALVATLLARGFPVYALNPKQLDRFRDRFTVAGAKDDRRDSRVLADSLRTDRAAFQPVPIDTPAVLELRELAHLEADYQRDRRRLTNQLREQVYRIAPALLTLCPAADEPWFWTLIETAPTPAEQQQLSPAGVRAILKHHRIRRLDDAQVRTALRAPALTLAPGVVEATRAAVALLIPHLRLLAAHARQCEVRQQQLLATLAETPATDAEPREQSDLTILTSLPGLGRKGIVALLTTAAQPLATRNYARLRALLGTAPITKASGTSRLVRRRLACAPRLREAAYHWGRVSLQRDAAAHAYYQRIRARGHSHGRALRAVVDRWLRILVAMLQHGTPYDPARFTTAPTMATAD
jgi:transposase